MLNKTDLRNVLFLDIETVSVSADYASLPEKMKKHWDRKAVHLKERADSQATPESLFCRAGIYSEFAKVICISTGVVSEERLRIKSYYGHDEHALLEEFARMLRQYYYRDNQLLCAHNGKEFDFPFLARRMIINRVEIPDILDNAGKKPWEVRHLDTMELWKFGDYKSYTSLELLTTLFDVPNPKNDIDGSEVGRIYWVEDDLPRIVSYCQRDVVALAQVMLRYQGKPALDEDKIVLSEDPG
ncbi:MAG: ribonuclease H-like domain-containing protein [Bacteroidetes bacterium]|nr:ribonuclease H-like domain-containing protein [Bacteroidota bacterium]